MEQLTSAHVGQGVNRRLPTTLNFGRLSYTQFLGVSGISSNLWVFLLLLKISVSCRTCCFTDVCERCEKVEKSKGQTTKEPARNYLLHRIRRNKFAEVIPVFSGWGTLCLLVPFGRQASIARIQHTDTPIHCGACGRIWTCYLLTVGSL